MAAVTISEYNPNWPAVFETIAEPIRERLGAIAIGIEHVGSTSVPGLAAKPIIDIDVVVRSVPVVPEAIAALATLGYQHRGDLGIIGREAFFAPPGTPCHHLYVCVDGSLALWNHLTLRRVLRENGPARERYADLKREIAGRFAEDPAAYTEAKSAFIIGLLEREGLAQDHARALIEQNRAPGPP